MGENQERRQARRQKRGALRVEEILQAAGALFAEIGYDKVTTNMIAARIKGACQALRLLPLGNRSSTRAWTSFASKLGKSSNIGCVQTFCNCCNKSG